jgi:mono/diheme cytochrome c family protein
MKEYIPIIIVIASLTFVSFCIPPGKNAERITEVVTGVDTAKSALVLYGEYIYQREDCTHCHTLPGNSNPKLISLDGVGGKYSDSWHYLHLQDPLTTVPGSDMPGYPELITKEINRQTLMELFISKNISADTSKIWIQARKEAGVITQKLKHDNFKVEKLEHKEIIALIAFIQQIPVSNQKKEADSILVEKQRMEDKRKDNEWNQMILDENSEVMKIANSKQQDTIAMGEAIFQSICFACHGKGGGGGIGPNLTDDYWLHGNSTKDILLTIKNGVPEKGMKSWKYDFGPADIGKLVAYIRSIKGTQPANAKAPQGKKE